MSVISEYPLEQTGEQVQQAINDALINLPYQLNQKANSLCHRLNLCSCTMFTDCFSPPGIFCYFRSTFFGPLK